jgi:O-antigen/teichoic acid export membrane protein
MRGVNLTPLQHILARLVLVIGGEAMQSAFHLGLNVALLHVISSHDFGLSMNDYGIFALVMVIGGLALTYIRSLTALPASIAIAQSRRASIADALEVTFGSAAACLSLGFGVAVVLLLSVWLDEGAFGGGLFIGLWALRSHLRTVYFARGRQQIISVSDLAFTLSGAIGAFLVMSYGQHVLQYTFLVVAGANALGIAVLFGFSRRCIRLHVGIHLRRRYARLWRDLKWSLLSITITNIQGQGMALMVAAFAGPAAYAPIAAALIMFVPLRITTSAFANMLHPELTGLVARDETMKIGRLMRAWPPALAAMALLYGIMAILALPWLQPDALEDARFYKISAIAWFVSMIPMLYVMPRIWLEITLDFRTIAILSAVAAGVGLSVVLGLLLTVSPPWALFGSAASELIVLFGSWGFMSRRMRASARLAAAPGSL